MFVLEIDFHDGLSQVERLLVRRPKFLLGATDLSHVLIDDMKALDYQLEFVRGVGSKFRCIPSATSEGVNIPDYLEGSFDKSALFEVGTLSLRVTSLDTDLLLNQQEPPDRAGVRVMRQACSSKTPEYPALLLKGDSDIVVSFALDQYVTAGRSNKCLLRVDAPDVSGEHARFGYESGKFWVEDLGSTNGTFVSGHQISGRTVFEPGQQVILGGDTVVVGILADSRDSSRSNQEKSSSVSETSSQSQFPSIVSMSELIRPARFVLHPGETINMGRDPDSDIWVGAPHVSRKHCVFSMSKSGIVTITDFSRNGVAFEDGLLPKNEPYELKKGSGVFDIGAGITFAICFQEQDEESFLETKGSFSTFYSQSVLQEDIRNAMAAAPGMQSQAITRDTHGAIDSASTSRSRFLSMIDKYLPVRRLGKITTVLFLMLTIAVIVVLAVLIRDGFQ